MRKTFKKIAAATMAVASLTVGMVSMSASAGTATDSYSKFEYTKSQSSAKCILTNSTNTNRYAQVSMTVYTADGTAFPGNYNPSLGYRNSVSCSYNGSIITGVEFYGTLYFNTTPYGTPVSSWYKTL